ncbi:uncharacterized protein LOC134534173 isoform X2 [Bacillus rossius redtenbacheri]|uniref:uncharacterized protein LOC134534173 isoform X2 n=1 Tax=Bacillus rossius redtenbacheri TaxID=93214 RepID=UPI002FDF09BA
MLIFYQCLLNTGYKDRGSTVNRVLQVWTAQCGGFDSNIALEELSSERDANSSSECTLSGKKCSEDCTRLITCISTGQHFHSESAECGDGEKCDPYGKRCSSSLRACPRFKCGGPGVFPDLVDCTRFHFCDTAGHNSSVACDEGYAYNVTAQECNIEVAGNPGVCETTPVPACVGPATSGALESNPSLYYVCDSSQQPVLHYCQGSLQYNAATRACEDASLACAIRISKFPDPNNCQRYYQCLKQGSFALHLACPSGQYFNLNMLACQPGTCKV